MKFTPAADCRHLTLRTIIFADENFRDGVLSAAVKILICEISRRDDKISSCNHDMDLVIGSITLMLMGLFGER